MAGTLTYVVPGLHVPDVHNKVRDGLHRINHHHKPNQAKLLILSLDGFHYQYLYRFQNELSFLKNNIAGQGILAERGMISTFTTLTLPCHWTMATGLYHESHGIVSNYFYDPYLNDAYMIGGKSMKEEKWYSGDPLWSVAVKQGKKFGVIAWIASDIDYKNFGRENATKVIAFDANHKLGDKLQTAYDWMFGKDNLDGVMVYHNNPDKVGHIYGAASVAVKETLADIDKDLKKFFDLLEANHKRDSINVVIVSDHGMANITRPEVFISDFGLNMTSLSTFVDGGGSLLKIFPKNLTAEFELIKKLTVISNQTKSFTLYRRHDLPERWHYKNNVRISPLLMVFEEGYFIYNNRSSHEEGVVADHGFDNKLDSMRPVFAATGPAFKTRQIMKEPFPQHNVFALFCHLLNVTPPPNNGSIAPFHPFLIEEGNRYHRPNDWKPNSAVISVASRFITFVTGFVLAFNHVLC